MEDNAKVDRFELFTAILLGLAAIGAAIAAFQGGQWGGKQLEAFADANKLTTQASTQYNEDTVMLNADYAAIAVAKQHILEARDARSEIDRDRHLDLASYFYMSQLSELAYQAMELPEGYWEEDEEAPATAAGAPVATPASAPPETTGGDAGAEEEGEEEAEEELAADDGETETAVTMERDIPDEDLFASLELELDEEYQDKMLVTGNEMFDQADARFDEGRQANENGDKFDLAGVFYTVALFFAGLGLVFKTQMRWGMFGLGAVMFAGTFVYMLSLPWAG
jgi:hypothetical protein